VSVSLIMYAEWGVSMPTKFKCPNCGSERTKPIPIAVAEGTRRRGTVGLSRRGVWGSASMYQTDFVRSISHHPAGHGCLITLAVIGLLYGLGSWVVDKSRAIMIIIISIAALVWVKTLKGQQSIEQEHWDRSWICARCGYRWEPSDSG
jgi:hypothetical protein